MPFTLESFARTRPYAYHLTARVNLPRITQSGTLQCAAALMAEMGSEELASERRPVSLPLVADGQTLHIRDQTPLHEGNIRFTGGWTFGDLVRDLNSRVFFWPGSAAGPIDYGQRHFERYLDERPVILRVGVLDLIEANAGNDPQFCKYNSGSPRWVNGKASPRGPDTFTECSACDFTAGKVVELTLRGNANLPRTCEIGDSPTGTWTTLF
jgi:hypothetical protein